MSHNWKQIAPPVFPELSPAINPLGFSQTGGFNTNGLEMKELWRLQGGGKVLKWKIEWKLYKEILLRKECVQWAFPDLFFSILYSFRQLSEKVIKLKGLGFEPQISAVGSDRSANFATATTNLKGSGCRSVWVYLLYKIMKSFLDTLIDNNGCKLLNS